MSFAQPANDACDKPTVLIVDAPCTNGTNVGATTQGALEHTVANCWGTAASHTVWYKFRTSSAGYYEISLDNGGTTDTEFKLWDRQCPANNTPAFILCNEDGGTANALAAKAGANLLANKDYWIQVDVYSTSTGAFCINVKYIPPIPNDCVTNAIDITDLVLNSVTPTRPFNCKVYDYANPGSKPTPDKLASDDCPCQKDIVPPPLNLDYDYFDVWYKFTLTAPAPHVWLDVYSYNGATFYSMALYKGTPGGTCGNGATNQITGLKYIDCSAGGLGNETSGSTGKLGGNKDVTECTIIYPRLNLDTIPAGTYYVRVWELYGSDPITIDQTNLCVESASPVDVASDRCPSTPKLGLTCGDIPNMNVNEIHFNQSNAGCFGNGCTILRTDEPVIAANAAGDAMEDADTTWTTFIGYANNVINNTSLYQFEVNPCATCQATVEIDLENLKYGGVNGNAIQVQLMNTGVCGGSSDAIIAYGGTPTKVRLRPSGNRPVPAGTYTLMIDGQDGQLISCDIRLKINYSGPNCTSSIEPKSLFKFNKDTVCVNTDAVITFTGTAGGVQGSAAVSLCPSDSVFAWTFDGGTGGTPAGRGPHNVKWATPGLKTVKCTINTDNCVSEFTKTIMVSGIPSAQIQSPNTICVGNSFDISLINPININSNSIYNWNFGGATVNSGSGSGPYNLTFQTFGAKFISVEITNPGCGVQTITKNITVNESPIASFSLDNNTICLYDSVNVSSLNVNADNTYDWDFDGAISTPNNSNGSGPYSLKWTSPGTHTIGLTITNAGCISQKVTKMVTVNELPIIGFTKTNISCFGANDGSISVNGTGGSNSYLFNINGNTFNSNNQFDNLNPGVYTIGIKDLTTGCIGATKMVTITQPEEIQLSLGSTTNSTCGQATGSASIDITNGVAPIQYGVDGSALQSSNNFSGLSAGNHTGYAIDANGCEKTFEFSIQDDGALNLDLVSKSNVSCNKGSDGTINVNVNGPNTYTYSIIGQPSNSNGVFTGLKAGKYSVSAKDDQFNCISTLNNVVISEPEAITAEIIIVNPSCKESADGTAEVKNIAGGTGNSNQFTYTWNTNPVQNSAKAINLTAGSYTVVIKDLNLCELTKTVTLVDPSQISINTTPNAAHCGQPDGSIVANASLGNGGPFTYSKDGVSFQSSGVFTNLLPGDYTISVKDKNGCLNSTFVNVPNLPGPTLTVSSDETKICSGGTSHLKSITNGVETIWTPAELLDNPNSANPVARPLKTTMFYCNVKDAFNCSKIDSILITIEPKDTVSFTFPTNSVCFGDANVKPVLDKGTEGVFFATPTGLIFEDENTGEIDVKNSKAGQYSIKFSSAKKCPNDTTVNFTIKGLPVADGGVNKNLCLNSSEFLGVAPIAGYSYSWTPTTDLDNPNLAQPKVTSKNTGATFSRRYYVTVSSNGCISKDSVDVNFNTSPIAEAGVNKTVKCNGKVNLLATATGGAGGFKFKWTGGPSTAAYNNVGVGKYFVTVTDAKGCTNLDSVIVSLDPNTLKASLTTDKSTPCPGETFVLTSSQTNGSGNITYTWSEPGLTGPGPHSLVAGLNKKTIILTMKDGVGCESKDTVIITPQPLPVAAFKYKKTGNSVEFTGSTFNNATAWEWDFGDRSLAGNGQIVTHQFNTLAVYDVSLYLTNPCGVDTFTCTINVDGSNSAGLDTCGTFSPTGLNSKTSSINSLKVYPNPTTGNVTLEMNNPEIETVKVFDVIGKLVYSRQLNDAASRFIIDLNNQSNGFYTIQVIGKNFNSRDRKSVV